MVGSQELAADVLSFWQWSASDLVSNTMRGVLAEYIVAPALGIDEGVRREWDAYDLVLGDGTKVEVKSAAYIQSWHQKKPSTIQFGVARKRAWDAETNVVAAEPCRSADVYIFALLAHTDRATINNSASRSIAALDPIECARVPIDGTKAHHLQSLSAHSVCRPTSAAAGDETSTLSREHDRGRVACEPG
ncbi:protein of unknown function [Hyphomicrobium sp. 1Nfss2.1]|uniref:hypothetical protein n=1 Tax=Hyphomicrobium sp. 1Nfss2.1 TaxID=3413936 RepID=UPI003C7E21A2